MKTHLIPCLKITFLTIVLFGVIYPLLITGIAKVTAPNGGEGSIIEVNGKPVGFELIGQAFDSVIYFNGRPSAVSYNAASTGGSNKGPTNPEYLEQVEERITDFLSKNPDIKREDVTVDLVTASGGGLDPHISPKAAMIQVPRVAKARGIEQDALEKLVAQYTEAPMFGLFGTPRVHVLRLNIALDQLKQ